ncbi:MAG: c-type cytochrome [Tahibacter sp.]
MSSPITKTDLEFMKHFSMVIGALALVAVVLMALAFHLYDKHPAPLSPQAGQQVEQRIAPVGAAYSGDTGRAAMLAAQEAAKKAAAAQVAYGGTTDGSVIFGQLCTACHTSGAGGSPKINDKAAWAPRVATGLETLVKHAIEGYTGKSGIMPARGGNPSLNDAQVKATVEWMLTQVK